MVEDTNEISLGGRYLIQDQDHMGNFHSATENAGRAPVRHAGRSQSRGHQGRTTASTSRLKGSRRLQAH
jgi:hypothetical protein